MPRLSRVPRPNTVHNATPITSTVLLEFLTPAIKTIKPRHHSSSVRPQSHLRYGNLPDKAYEVVFLSALSCVSHSQCNQIEKRKGKRWVSTKTSTSNALPMLRESSTTQFSPPENYTPSPSIHDKSQPNPLVQEVDRALYSTSQPHRNLDTRGFFDPRTTSATKGSHLPEGFFEDVLRLQKRARRLRKTKDYTWRKEVAPRDVEQTSALQAQLKLMKTVRELEAQLVETRTKLDRSLNRKRKETGTTTTTNSQSREHPMILTKDDYMNLVDLYYYSHKNLYSPESPDSSPTPLFLDEYSFKLSADFSKPPIVPNEDENYISPLKEVEEMLRHRQLNEISLMTTFVDLLLDDSSSLVALFDAYRKFPDPGVAYLPNGVIRLFLQRMSTPLQKSEKSMVRYLSLIDDMQRAGLPISRSEWSSAIYLAGRSFSRVTEGDVAAAFRVWKQMEDYAGVTSHHVTFNILFDIAVRAEKFALAEAVLKEMHDRGLMLNRLGRVSMIYYHGLRGDGDAVRKTYRDFVEAGEIVDTLVLNCVMASLFNAQEPTAAEQTYERMKNLQSRYQKGVQEDGSEGQFLRYPPPGSNQLDHEMASNQLDRVLLRAANLREVLPEHHSNLQNIMPLTPDHITFRSMINYHATKSGDIDRVTFLMNEMIQMFNLPLRAINFQLLFKGFALHGGLSKHDDAGWTVKRLDLCWEACRATIKEQQGESQFAEEVSNNESTKLPSMNEVNATERAFYTQQQRVAPSSKPRKLSAWHNFVLDLAAFPRERRKPIERVHSQDFDDEDTLAPGQDISSFRDPFFQHVPVSDSSSNAQDVRSLDHEEGEYVLPLPTESVNTFEPISSSALSNIDSNTPQHPVHQAQPQTPTELAYQPQAAIQANPNADSGSDLISLNPSTHDPSQTLRINRPLICWLLRAYTRCTASRSRVEEVYNSAKKLWRPVDHMERDAVVRVLRRCLRDCDRYRGPGF